MKAHKYKRFSQGAQISLQSLSLNETVIYLPEIKRVVYEGFDGYKMTNYFGVCDKNSESEKLIILEAEEYISDIKSNKIKVLTESDIEELPFALKKAAKAFEDISSAYATVAGKLGAKTPEIKPLFIKKIGESKQYGDREELYLSEYEEFDLDITEEDIQTIANNKAALESITESNKSYQEKIFPNK